MMMATKRFLFVMVEGGGNVSSQMGIARRLAARGHEVRVLADAAIEPEARAAGCSFAPFASAPAIRSTRRSSRSWRRSRARATATSRDRTANARARRRRVAG